LQFAFEQLEISLHNVTHLFSHHIDTGSSSISLHMSELSALQCCHLAVLAHSEHSSRHAVK